MSGGGGGVAKVAGDMTGDRFAFAFSLASASAFACAS